MALVNARALLEHGLSGLALLDLHPEHAAEEINLLRKDFPTASIVVVKVNVTSAEDLKNAIEKAVQELGNLDILCCFAGVVGCTHAIEMSESEWKRTLEINTTGSFLAAQATARSVPPLPFPSHFTPIKPKLTTPPLPTGNSSTKTPPAQSSSPPPSPRTGQTIPNPKPPTTPPKPPCSPLPNRSPQNGPCMGLGSIVSRRGIWIRC